MWVEKHRKVYRIRELIGDRQITLATGYANKRAAQEAMAILKAEQLTGTGIVPRGGERIFGEYLDQWWADRKDSYTKLRTRESIEGVMERYLRSMLGHLTMDQLSHPTVVQRWVGDLLAGRTKVAKPKALSPTTVRNAHGLLFQIMQDAVKVYRLIRANPCANTKLPDEVDVEMRFLTPAEADRLIAALPPHWRPLVLFLLATGCRWGEALGLRMKNLDVLARRARILKKTIEIGGKFVDEEPKSRRGRRTVRFPIRVADALVPITVIDDDRERRVFLGPRGGMIAHKRFYPVWHAATKAAGLAGLRVHDLRHTHVAWLIAANVPLSAISRRIGHKSIAVTDDIYGHLLEEVDERLVAALDEAMGVIEMGGDWGGIGGEGSEEPVQTEDNTGDPMPGHTADRASTRDD